MMANFYKLILNGIYKLPAYAQILRKHATSKEVALQ